MIRRLRFLPTPVLLLVLLLGAGCELFNEVDPGEGGLPGPGPLNPPLLLYVANQDDASVTVIDMNENEVLRTVNLTAYGFAADAAPYAIAVEPDASAWYVALSGANLVAKFTREDELVATVPTDAPGMLLLHPTQRLLLASRAMTAASPPAALAFIDPDAMALTQEVDVFVPRPHALAVSPDGRYAYTAGLSNNQIAAVDLETRTIDLTTLTGAAQGFVQFAVRPNAPQLYATGELTGQLLRFTLDADPTAPTLASVTTVGDRPWQPVFSPDGATLYVPNKGAGTVTVFDAETRQITATIADDAFAQPHGSVLHPDGRYVYVSNNGAAPSAGHVAVIDAQTNAVVATLPAGRNAAGMGAQAVRIVID